jgi:hypothetical protein
MGGEILIKSAQMRIVTEKMEKISEWTQKF